MKPTEQPEANADSVDDSARTPRRRTKRKAEQAGTIDIRESLEAPVRVKQNGASVPMDPYEAMLRQHVRKSLVERSVASMKLVLGEAEKHKIIKPPPPAEKGGVFVVPKDLPEDIQRQIFDPDCTSMSRIYALLLTVIDIERLKRCFNGR